MLKIESSMKQKQYNELAKTGETWDELKAKEWINRECGFEYGRIKILYGADIYELITDDRNLSRYHRLNGPGDRSPYYDATDWNYCRFIVKGTGRVWEIINGELIMPDMTDYE